MSGLLLGVVVVDIGGGSVGMRGIDERHIGAAAVNAKRRRKINGELSAKGRGKTLAQQMQSQLRTDFY